MRRPHARTVGPRSDPRVPALLDWFDRHRRPLPWRKRPTPYRTWVAEVLLQQTRVAQAAPYFERFITAFPSVAALAHASEQEVLKQWEGAGYYARARNLRLAARRVMLRRNGELPRRLTDLRRLPGVGPYIAAAIASLAFGEHVPALEVNGLRVVVRWTLESGDPKSSAVRQRLAKWVSTRLPRDRPGAFNEALMELGETTCLPRAPRCGECPVATWCRARQELPDPGSLPRPRGPRHRPRVVAAVAVVARNGRWLVLRRPSSGLLGGLWEFPGGKVESGESPVEACRREVREETGLRVGRLRPLGVVRHGYSHFTVRLHLFRGAVSDGRPVRTHGRPFRWVTANELRRLPIPRATLKALDLLMGPAGRVSPG